MFFTAFSLILQAIADEFAYFRQRTYTKGLCGVRFWSIYTIDYI